MTDPKIFVNELAVGQNVKAPFMVFSASLGQTSRGSQYLSLEVGDKTGKISAKVWDADEAMVKTLAEGEVAMVGGYVDSYKGLAQLIIKEASAMEPSEVHWPDYIKSAQRPIGDMKKEFWALVEKVEDPDLNRLLKAVFTDREVDSLFWTMPAAKSFHHAYMGGLLEHSLAVGRLAVAISPNYAGKISADLVLTGALLHDLGKIWEFTPPPRIDYTTSGRLVGHLVMGSQFVGVKAGDIPGFPPQQLELVQHLILSHHGEPLLGTVRKPQILEAMVLHAIDNLDAKLNAVGEFIENQADPQSGWTGYHRLLENHFMKTPAPRNYETVCYLEELEKPLPPNEETGPQPGEDEEGQSEGRLF